jgi:hypothetical protein
MFVYSFFQSHDFTGRIFTLFTGFTVTGATCRKAHAYFANEFA